MEFYEQLPKLSPAFDARSWFVGNPGLVADTAVRNSSLQGAYFILAAAPWGSTAGPMSGFDPEKVNAEFFPDGKWRANFLCNLGYGDAEKLYLAPRLEFEEACRSPVTASYSRGGRASSRSASAPLRCASSG